MKTYVVYEHSSDFAEPEAVKVGFSWPAFFFSWAWAFTKQLPKHGALLLGGFIAVTAIENTQPSESLFNELSGLVWFAISLVAGAYGNSWRASDLADRDFRPVDRLEADSPSEATALAMAEDLPVGRDLESARR